ncbi:AsmA family protein [Psychromonas sp. CD1]|uniref:AsmA family protein n=1 Tax=Psychromonas sp. CD1 TaxID=1979839 RepID=UPI000B9A86F4|nr:AsmA family protein [Psychromonas sp. CD1]
MKREEIEAFALKAAKGLKTQQDLLDFTQVLTKITIEAALNAELKTTKSTVNNTNNESFFDMSKLVFEGINITNTVIEIQDLANKSYNHIRIQKMHLSQFEFSKDSDFTLISEVLFNNIKINITLTSKINISQDMTRISLKDLILNSQFSGPDIPNGKLTSTLKTNAIYQIKSKKLTLNPFQIMLDKIKLKGQVSVQNGALTKVRYTLFGNQWDLNPYLSKKSTITPATKNKNKIQNTNNRNTSAPEIEPNLSFLTHLDVQGDLTIAGILYENIKIGEITTKLFIKKGKASLNPLNIKLYKGQLNAKASIDDAKGKNIYQINTQLKGVQLRPLLIDVAEIDFISGQTAFTFNGTGIGLTAASIKQGLTGQGNFSLLDGEIYGVNIHQDIRRLKAKLKGKKPPTEKDIKKTDFASLNGDFTLGNGIINNQKLLMLSPILRLDGTGLINIINNTLDYQLSIAPLSQRGTETEQFDLKGVVIPMHIKGSLTDPKFSLDMQGALKAQLKEKVNAEKKRLQRKLENKLKGRLDDKSKQFLKKEGKEIENLLKGLFG